MQNRGSWQQIVHVSFLNGVTQNVNGPQWFKSISKDYDVGAAIDYLEPDRKINLRFEKFLKSKDIAIEGLV